VKRILLNILVLVGMIAAAGCASTPWLEDITQDPRLSDLREGCEPIPMKLAVAQIRILPQANSGEDEARERNPVTADPKQIRESIIQSLTKTGIFSTVRPLDTPERENTENALMQAAWDNDYDLVLSLDIRKFETYYDGVNGWYIPNIVNWLFLLVPSWWVKDEVYGAVISVDATLRSARSGNVLYQEELSAQFKRSFNDFQRGWQLAGIFRVPGSLGESNWRRIGNRLLPGILYEIQVQTILGLNNDFRLTTLQPDFESLLKTRLALVVGISRHKDHNISKLKYTEEDAISVHKYLTDPEGGQVPSRNVRLLTNERASKAEILESLDYLAEKSRELDSIVIYFAGYGARLDNKLENGKPVRPTLFLVPYDANPQDIEKTCISINEIEKKLADTEAREILIILDTSFGGDMESRSLAGRAETTGIFENILKQSGRYLLLSGKPGEGAMEISDHRHGVFTFYMLEGLKGPADSNKNDIITLGELHNYLSGKVAEETEMEGNAQHPNLRGTGASDMHLNNAP
jgi:hypothetical protein